MVFLLFRFEIDDADGKVISGIPVAVVFGVTEPLANFVSQVAFIAILFFAEDNLASWNKAFTLQILFLKEVVSTCLDVLDCSTVVEMLLLKIS